MVRCRDSFNLVKLVPGQDIGEVDWLGFVEGRVLHIQLTSVLVEHGHYGYRRGACDALLGYLCCLGEELGLVESGVELLHPAFLVKRYKVLAI